MNTENLEKYLNTRKNRAKVLLPPMVVFTLVTSLTLLLFTGYEYCNEPELFWLVSLFLILSMVWLVSSFCIVLYSDYKKAKRGFDE